MKYLVTGGAGFIGSALFYRLMQSPEAHVTIVDKMTYAANPASLAPLESDPRFRLVRADICDLPRMMDLVRAEAPDVIFHLAAETHVDRSIDGAGAFVQTNLVGTFAMLQAARAHFEQARPAGFRFVHVSTDEVFGSLGAEGLFDETTAYDPSSPYSATKAGADHLAHAWHRTYGLPVVVSNCSNNYGPRQFPEKLIPLVLLNALDGKPLPVYGDGLNVRDWLHVEDHADALVRIAEAGVPGQSYAVGGNSEKTNIEIVRLICSLLDARRPSKKPHTDLITYVIDRPGHDRRYAIDAGKIKRDLGWAPSRKFEQGLADTVDWYLANADWWRPLRDGVYAGDRLGKVEA
ncbi:dTDP-glucose 4,6-dehydratase [Hyphomonas sp.]|uniref:dTDP-glucose 4,6-dehydratase n=1 Tax=Hyphomonas sp. TaxID=87 RepID=UPI0032EEA00E